MLSEVGNVRQIPGEPARRWFTDAEHDLFVWIGSDGTPQAFQFCYGKGRAERALTWFPKSGFTHRRVDEGMRDGVRAGTPLLGGAIPWHRDEIGRRFLAVGSRVPAAVAHFVLDRLRCAPAARRVRRRPAGRRRRA